MEPFKRLPSGPSAGVCPGGKPRTLGGPSPEPTPGPSWQEEEEEGGSSSAESGLQILLLPSRSSSRASAPWGSPDHGSGPTEGPEESAGETSVVPETPPGPSLQASPLAVDQPAPRWARRRTPRHHQLTATDPQLLAIYRRQLEVAEQHLQLQERALAWRQEAWRAYMETFNRLVDYLAPHAAPAAAASALPAPPAAPPAAPHVAIPSAVAPPPTAEGWSAEGPQEPAETRRAYLLVHPAPSQPQTGLRPQRGSRPPTPSAGL
ncbi:uncharacterized protein LOC142014504 [Carettochelys insculpta]|uniref:uncharacterized protein LOC142014504 n=1 Tax=Carettochelys insculpta TaxID=44489 RepID=UPI003EB6B4E3